ncbi:MAG: hypothetical protein HOV81_43945, partial [Kofleriaceae bacterium]|nr:hypothetical protein [Kofleriaceae bacterium]
EDEAKLGANLVRDWKAGKLSAVEYTAVVLDGTLDDHARALIISLGGRFLRPVLATPTELGSVVAEEVAAGTPGERLFAMVPNEALRFLAAQPWVTRMDAATAWSGPNADAVARGRLDPTLWLEMMTLGSRRRYAVSGLGQMKGCITDEQRGQMRATGAIVHAIIAGKDCDVTIFSFEVPLDQLAALASLPFIVNLEGEHQRYLTTGG